MTVATRAGLHRPSLLPLLAETARDLFPGYFAPVMATGGGLAFPGLLGRIAGSLLHARRRA